MAEPLAPKGYIRLKDAYDTYLFGRLGEPPSLEGGYSAEHAAHANLSDEANRLFVQALDQIAYGGKVVSHDGKTFEVSGDLFDRAGFADLLPLHSAIPSGISGPLANYIGGIVCLKGQVFFEWLKQHLSTHLHGEIQNGDLTPIAANARLATVKLPALATAGWVWESADEPKLSDLMFFEAAETYYDNAPLKFIKESREELWRALQSGEIIAIGSEGGGSHQKIASERWASLEIQPVLRGREYVGAGQYGDSERIYDMKLLSKDVQSIWKIESSEIEVNATAAEPTSASISIRNKPSFNLAIKAIEAVFPAGVPSTLRKRERDDKIARWLKCNGHLGVSPRTIQSALKALNK